jgi:hypothetical protein
MQRRSVRSAVLVAILFWIAAPELSLWAASQRVATLDRNGDGRPDLWRTYNSQGEVVSLAIDTNFDGRSDVEEYYDHGALVARDSDRNFDNQIDLVEKFDETTQEHVQSIADEDFDGTADVLVLFQDGRQVFSEVASRWISDGATAPAVAPDRAPNGGTLVRLANPFDNDLVIQKSKAALNAFGRGWTAPRVFTCLLPEGVTLLSPSGWIQLPAGCHRHAKALDARSPRGPPLAPSQFSA